jgi:hypothetical protein
VISSFSLIQRNSVWAVFAPIRKFCGVSRSQESQAIDCQRKKESIFRKLAKALGEVEEETSEDIDKQVEAEVRKVKATKLSGVKGEDVLSGEWGGKGDIIHIMDLAPIYDAIGSRGGRLYTATKLICQKAFEQRVVAGAGRAALRGEQLVMRFYSISPKKGFILAANIVNDVGVQVLGERFYTIEVPEILRAVDAGDLALEDGSLSLDKLPEALENGGLSLEFDEPDEDAPVWAKLLWKKRREYQARLVYETAKAKKPAPAKIGAPRQHTSWARRKFGDRRMGRRPFEGEDRRKGVDRRGRGF